MDTTTLVLAIGVAVFVFFLLLVAASKETQLPEEWSYDIIYNEFSPHEFEYLIAELWEDKGYNTVQSDKGPDGGVDVKASKRGTSMAIEIKQYKKSNSVGDPVVKKAMGAAQDIGTVHCYVITSSYFTSQAKKTEENNRNVRLIDGMELIDELQKSTLKPEDFEEIIS